MSQPLSIVFEHPQFYLFHKPHDLSFHQDGDQSGLCQLVNSQTGEQLYPVHRLDRMTSGLVLFARNQQAASELSQAFARREVTKCYLAISDKKPKKKQGLVKGDMAASRRGDYKLLRSQDNPAITRFESASVADGVRLYLLKPHTGKTHQLRVMMKSIGAPIVGDDRYYPQNPASNTSAPVADRGYLHAWMLQFSLAGEPFQFFASPQSGTWFAKPSVQLQIEQWQQQLQQKN